MAAPVETIFEPRPLPRIGPVGPAPSDFVTTRDEQIRISTVNSQTGVTLEVTGRVTDEGGRVTPVQFDHTPNTDRTLRTTDHVIGAASRLNLTVQASAGTPRIGQTYVIVQLVRGISGSQVVLATLFAGYVTANQPLAMPGSTIESSIAAGGVVRTISGTAPAAGVEISETVPTGARWELLSFGARLTASAVAGTRQPQLVGEIGAAGLAIVTSPQTQGAGAAQSYFWMPGMALATAIAGAPGQTGWPLGMALLAGAVLRTSTVGLLGGDQWGAPEFTVREWLEVA